MFSPKAPPPRALWNSQRAQAARSKWGCIPRKLVFFRRSEARSPPCPEVPGRPRSCPTEGMSPKDAGVCFHPKPLPPAPCGTVKRSRKKGRNGGADPGNWCFSGGLSPGHPPAQKTLDGPVAAQHRECLQRTREYVFTQSPSPPRPVEQSEGPGSTVEMGVQTPHGLLWCPTPGRVGMTLLTPNNPQKRSISMFWTPVRLFPARSEGPRPSKNSPRSVA